MGIRLNKVLSELNISLQTVLDYLKIHSELGDVREDATTNTKISDEQYNALVQEFRIDKITREKANILKKLVKENKAGTNSSKSNDSNQLPSSNTITQIKNHSNYEIGKNNLETLSFSNPHNERINYLVQEKIKTYDNPNLKEGKKEYIELLEEKKIIKGKVVSINKRDVTINIGNNLFGYIPTTEFRYNPKLKKDDIVDVFVERCDKNSGHLTLSHKKALMNKAWADINNALDNKEVISAYVKNRAKNGLVVEIKGIEAFLPNQHLDIVRVNDIDKYVGKTIDVKIIKVNQEFNNIVVSRKEAILESLNKKKADKSLLKEIWQRHTEVQEQILRQRTAPIVIIPNLSTIINDKLHVRVDTSDNTELLKSKIIESLELNEDDCHFEDGYVFAPISKWEKLDERTKSRISTRANSEYVTFTYYPVIDGKITDKKAQFTEVKSILDKLEIEYDFDKKRRLQISLNDLQKLRENEEFAQMNISLPEKASAIIPTYPSILTFLERLSPNHNVVNIESFRENRGAASEVNVSKQIIVNGGYLKQEILDIINPIFNLKMFKVEFTFQLDSTAVKRYNWKKNEDGLPELKNGRIIFKRGVRINKEEEFGSEEINEIEEQSLPSNEFRYIERRPVVEDVDLEYSLIKRGLDRIFGKNQYLLENERYFYYYRENKNWATAEELDTFNDRIHAEISTSDDFRIQSNGLSIGIDFNWKETSLADILTNLSKQYQFIDFGLFKKGHKCNFDIQYKKANLTGLMEDLHNAFEELTIELIGKGTELHFSREFQSYDELTAFRLQLKHKLDSFDQNRYNCIIFDTPVDKVKLTYFYDRASREEEQQAAARELKGAEFKVGDLSIGKLIRVSNYPELVFDISGYNFETTKTIFEETEVTSITPDLTGDLEKLARLKKSLNRILENDEVENPSLGDFIFDASKAHEIKDFEESLRLELQEISKHILNEKIDKNEPQKIAIAKALLAPDLALIQGPPGTGKSTAIAEMIWQHTRKYPEKRILLTSETNLAVDNAIDRIVNPYHNLIKPIRIGDESRLETEGLQFSYSAMYRWAKGEEWRVKKNADEDENDDDDFIDGEENVYEAPEKLILLNWMENIVARMDKRRMPLKAQTLWKELLDDPTPEVKNMFFENYIDNCNVIGATCSSIGKENIILTESIENTGKRSRFVPTLFYRTYREVFKKRDNEYNPKIRFDMVIQDESSKATPAELSLPLIYGIKNVIIGDHRQLPPMLSRESFVNSFDFLIKRGKSEDEKNRLKELKSYVLKNFKILEISHFERLYGQIDDNLKGVFNYQFRMHPAINEVIKQFYNDVGGLKCGLVDPVDLGIDDPDFIRNKASRYHGIDSGEITPDTHVLWIDSSSPEMLDGTSRVNYGEVEVIKKLLTKLNNSKSFHEYNNKWDRAEDQQIGLISFYGKQLRLLREITKEFDSNELPIRVSTVDRFQGMERNIIIVSMVRSHCIQTEKDQKPNFDKYPEYGYAKQEDLGFAQSPNRLNVALSRAKRLLIIVGNSKLFRSKDIYDNVYTTIVNHPNGKIIKAEDYGL